MSDFEYSNFFPYSEIREQQKNAIDFAIDAFVKQNKRFVVIEAGTGVGKSAIGLTLARYLNKHALFSDDYTPGSYFLTTQKILQDQYLRDFGKPSGCMLSIKSTLFIGNKSFSNLNLKGNSELFQVDKNPFDNVFSGRVTTVIDITQIYNYLFFNFLEANSYIVQYILPYCFFCVLYYFITRDR